jgi:GT2 family glycosyltransferase
MRIGIAIPAYIRDIDSGRLEVCLDSIEAQTRQPDVVAISVSSYDHETLELKPRPFAIKYVTTPEKQLAAKNRNDAANLIIHDVDVIVFMDADDTMVPYRNTYIERAFIETMCDYLLHNYAYKYSKTHNPNILHNDYQVYENAFVPNHVAHSGLLVKHDVCAINDIHHGHIAVRSHVFCAQQQDTAIMDVRWEDAEYAKRLYILGYKGVYCSAQLTIYNTWR